MPDHAIRFRGTRYYRFAARLIQIIPPPSAMSISREHKPVMSTAKGEAGDNAREPALRNEIDMRPFPTLPEAPVSSNVRKAQVRAALFRKMEPVRVGRFILLKRFGP